MYMETFRDGKRIVGCARRVARRKPVVLLRQTGVVNSPTLKLLLPIGHAQIERPPMRGEEGRHCDHVDLGHRNTVPLCSR